MRETIVKKIWCKIFCWQNAAAGALWGATLLIGGCYFAYITFMLLWGNGLIAFMGSWPLSLDAHIYPYMIFFQLTAVGLWAQYCFFTARFYYAFFYRSWGNRGRLLWGMLVSVTLGIGAVGLLQGRWEIALLAGVLLCEGIFLLVAAWRQKRVLVEGLLMFLLAGCGGGGLFAVGMPMVRNICDFTEPQNVGFGAPFEGWIAIGAILSLVAAYLLRVRVFAQLSAVSWRSQITKRLILLWLMMLIAMGVGQILAWGIDIQYVQEKRKLEALYGYPVSVAGLRERYGSNYRPDQDFWNKILQIHALKWTRLPDHLQKLEAPENMQHWPERARQEYRREICNLLQESLEMDEMLEEPLPDYPYEFRVGQWMWQQTPHFRCGGELGMLQLWNLYFALEAGEPEKAWQAYRRIRNLYNCYVKEISIPGQLVALKLTDMLASGLNLLKESGELANAESLFVQEEFVDLKARIAEQKSLALYGHAVLMLDIMEGALAAGDLADSESDLPVLSPNSTLLRFLTPYFWWLLRKDEIKVIRLYQVTTLGDIQMDCEFHESGIFSSSLFLDGEKVESIFANTFNRLDKSAADGMLGFK